MIEISAIVPTFNRPRELRLCLEGFAAQTAPRESFEVIVIDDGSAASMESLVAEFSARVNVIFRRTANSGPSAARNLAIDIAAAPLLVLYDDDLCPLPDLVSHCVKFHAHHCGECDAALLWFSPAESIRNDALIEALFPRMYPFPVGNSIWGTFWSGSLTCKKSIFRGERFREEFRVLEDMELEIRLRRSLELNVELERHVLGHYTRPLTLEQFLDRSYRFGYYDYRLACAHPIAWVRSQPLRPDGALSSAVALPGIVATIKSLANRQPPLESPLFRMLQGLLAKAEAYAHADGWESAANGGSPTRCNQG